MTTVLVVEDNESNRYMLTTLLRSKDFTVFEAINGQQALEILHSEKIGLIISDILMPYLNGFELCKIVKNSTELKHIPFIFYTATFVDEKDEHLALSLGASRFIVKPIEPADFLVIVTEVLEEYNKGELTVPTEPLEDEDELLSMYSFSITRKLEETVDKLKTERHSLARSEKKLQEAQMIARLGYWEYNFRLKSVQWSSQLFHLLEYAVITKNESSDILLSHVHPDDKERVKEYLSQAITNHTSFSIHHRMLTMNKKLMYVFHHCETIFDESGRPDYILGIIHDITDIKRAEIEQKKKDKIILQSQKLTALGELAAGMIHEINQPLSVILMNCQLGERAITKNSPPHSLLEYFQSTKECVQRIIRIMDNVRVFSRDKKTITFKPINLNESIEQSLELTRSQFKTAHIEMEIKLAGHLPPISGDIHSLEQVFLNLLNNARHALMTKKKDDDSFQPKITVKSFVDSNSVQAIVEDNGTGIPLDHVDKLFDPFFTTKSEDEGTGLGLSVSYGIVKEMNGEIRVETEENLYTRFILSFPIYKL